MSSPKTLFVAGVSSGFGRALAQKTLAAGHRVVGTVRSGEAKLDFEALDFAKAFGRVLDVTQFDAIDGVVAEAEATIGPIDVLVNNAGYGHEGVMEESPLAATRRQFDVNVFGAVAMMKAVLPYMRERRHGRILNITSMGGYITMHGIAYYCGSKFALEGISEVLGKEMKPFGVFVTAVAPGAFRTDWAGRSMVRTPRVPSPIMTRCSTLFARLARKGAASRWATPRGPRRPCWPSSTIPRRLRICCWVATRCAWSGKSWLQRPTKLPRGRR